jgi:hypothetical protein
VVVTAGGVHLRQQQTQASDFADGGHYISKKFVQPLEYPALDLVSDFPKFDQLLLFGACKGQGIFKGPEQALLGDAGKGGGAGLFGSMAHDDDVSKIYFAQVFLDPFGVLAAQVQPRFGHDLAGEGVDVRGLKTGAINLKAVSGVLFQEGFRHLAASRIVGAQKEDLGSSPRIFSHDYAYSSLNGLFLGQHGSLRFLISLLTGFLAVGRGRLISATMAHHPNRPVMYSSVFF